MSERNHAHPDTTLPEAVEQKIDQSIKRAFTVPALPDSFSATTATQSRTTMSPTLRVAAGVLLLLTAVMGYRLVVNPPVQIDANRVYTSLAGSMIPTFVCDTPEKFRDYAQEHLGLPLNANYDTPAQLIGWRPLSQYGLSPDEDPGRILLARDAAGESVLVVFITSERYQLADSSDPALHTHRQRFGSIRAIEISPNATPGVLPLLGL